MKIVSIALCALLVCCKVYAQTNMMDSSKTNRNKQSRSSTSSGNVNNSSNYRMNNKNRDKGNGGNMDHSMTDRTNNSNAGNNKNRNDTSSKMH